MNKKLELLYNGWDEISINKFYKIQEIIEDESLNDFEKNIELLSIFTGMSKNELVNVSMNECEAAIVEIKRIFDKELPKSASKTTDNITIICDGEKKTYKLVKNLDEISVAQYIDFQNYVNSGNKNNIAEVLSIFLIPKGNKYAEGYDVAKLIDTINENVDIITARQLYNFFLHKLKKSTNHILTSFRWMMKIQMWKMGMDKNLRKAINKTLKATEIAVDGFIS